jgi:thymidine phosphorylase
VAPRSHRAALRRAEARLWSGRAAHLTGGTLDFMQALVRYLLARRRGRAVRWRRRAGARRRHP